MRSRIELKDPSCPFCYHKIEQPKELRERKIIEFPLGVCEHCGAVYVYDVTGHNMGSAFIEALLFACNYDDSLAFSLSYGEDYADAVIGPYDIIMHKILSEKIYEDRYIRGVLIFVKLIQEFQEVAGEKVKKRIGTALPVSEKKRLHSEKFSREKVQGYVSNNNLEELIALAEEDSRVLSELQRMLYTPDENSRWRIIEILGQVCRKVGEKRPDVVSKFLSRLLESAKYPGASAWGALEAGGTIISTNPDLFGEYSEAILSFLKDKNFWKEATWAIGRIAAAKPKLVKYAFKALRSFLDEQEPALRGYAAWALGSIGFTDVIEKLKALETDKHTLTIWRDADLQEVTVAQMAKEAIEKINICRSHS
ncbi:MAG: hypothetical protein COY75_00025 [Nitrospirae bacterium CG_4_10_14_0_8_um_filter_41_23]|nr:hypothetical protein [Nitrospirota bacterium]OIP60229.1 MAG: hypothetical protein AUK38_04060 [Nitrospirae bacterium CG2_30_41_42]PIQ94618.1 MAG: hypothetical protein COV68_03540 [Nitrospirae bacterium CG11_big_fil_rev_8_21_14_0_20_41_14]PIV44407.1 MAG: hypothetical protein COS27_01820 [Nitrospirae bacterium CG02_land_8_20_14_3_00_41_53]PIW88364.1 MAG: hypothetical protein COZ94_00240 [Nitrospirae bacterium CG_4_8_14_3_um_filter_41_47]PIY87933.1 MAG: hypothetical protein COY75_00025 [Nitros